jgi:hypothetical protein
MPAVDPQHHTAARFARLYRARTKAATTASGAGLAVAATIAAVLALAAPAAAASVVTRSSGPLSATLTASTHTPKINVPMSIKVTATLNGKPARATLIYQYLYGGAVVSTRYPCNNKACTFTGHYSDNLTFPATSLGEPLTLQVVVKASGHTVKLDSSITSHR